MDSFFLFLSFVHFLFLLPQAYTGMAKQLGDDRFEDLRGKLLRRVDIRQVVVLP